LSNFETAGVAGYIEDSAEKASLRAQKSENTALGQKMPFVDGHYRSKYGISTYSASLGHSTSQGRQNQQVRYFPNG